MNLFLCVKYKNEGKLSSHNWFFNGFCKELQPRYVVLLDVGLKSEPNAIYNMYHQMKLDPKVGGVCGYMSLKIEKTAADDEPDVELDGLSSVCGEFVDIQRAQQVEYHFAHLIDKPFEGLFGFIHVLPGAFSAYSMEAVFENDENETLLRNYFSSLENKAKQSKIVEFELTLTWMVLKVLLPDFLNEFLIEVDPDSEFQHLKDANMFLAEDRILCMGLHTKGYSLLYLPDAFSEVDPIKSLHALFGQRKRWINGSFFAFEKVKDDLSEHERRGNLCEWYMHLQMLYLTFSNAVSYFSPSFFLFTVHMSMVAFEADALS